MLPWTLFIICLLLGLRLSLRGASAILPGGIAAERARLKSVVALLQEIEETLATGLVPAAGRWAALRALPAPWGELAADSLQELRSCGGALLPTIRRLRALAQEHDAALLESRARSSQALGQAVVCALLVPAFGSALYGFLPGIQERAIAWAGACGIAVALAGVGALWMLAMADDARWAGLPRRARPWMLAAQCAGERFLALVRSGNPTDLAWARACALLKQEAPELALRWGASVWSSGGASSSGVEPTAIEAHRAPLPARASAARSLEELGSALRKAVQVSLMEGRPCTERVETALAALRQDLRSLTEQEQGLLGTRALKPLFVFVAPALLALLGFGLWLSWLHVAGSGEGSLL
jgi:hypothetical protein